MELLSCVDSSLTVFYSLANLENNYEFESCGWFGLDYWNKGTGLLFSAKKEVAYSLTVLFFLNCSNLSLGLNI